MKLGKRIAAWRRFRGLTQQQLGDVCGITASAVCAWEKNSTGPSQDHLALVVKRFGVTMERFYGRGPGARE